MISSPYFENEDMKIYLGDSFKLLREMNKESIDVIATDPPYNIGIDDWDKINNYEQLMEESFIEMARIIKKSGSMYWFHNQPLAVARFMLFIENNTNLFLRSMITIDKPTYADKIYKHFRGWLNSAEYCLFYTRKNEFIEKESIDYFQEMRKKIGLPKAEIKRQIQLADHCFRVSKDNFGLPTKETYEEIISRFNLKGWAKKFEDIAHVFAENRHTFKTENNNKFNMDDNIRNVWYFNFTKGRETKHKTEKPLALMEKIILASSVEKQIIFDPFMGSGTTGVAAIRHGRKFIGIEKEEKFVEMAVKRIQDEEKVDVTQFV